MRYLLAAGLPAMLFLGPAGAAEMNIKPGKWEFRTTTSMLMPGAPREVVNSRCIETPAMSPEMLMKGMDRGCELTDTGSDAEAMSWTVRCTTEAGSSTGKGHVQKTSDDTLTGAMSMSISFNGQTNNIDMEWDGAYVGACD